MKPILTAAALLLALCLCLPAALASGGDAADPLISRSYLEGTFSESLNETIRARADAADKALRDAVGQGSGGASSAAGVTLKEDDVLSASAGTVFVPLRGEVRASGGTLVDVTEGREAAPGPLERGHRYILAEDASLTIASPAAVVSWEGPAVLAASAQPDCFAIASALRSLGLFRGTGSGVGEGFDLDQPPTRGEGLVMFLRILGEEQAALESGYTHPFADVPGWLSPYVAWAYEKGYSNGVSDARFAPDQPLPAQQYVELLLRALGYSSAGTEDFRTSLERALADGVLTERECQVLRQEPFLRAHVAYLSYYSLDAALSGTRQTLAQRLAAAGVVSGEQLAAARAMVETLRLG